MSVDTDGIPAFLLRAPEPVPFHPLANLFPMMDDEAHRALAADIKEHGQHSAIILHEGQILDGRNRYRACVEAGVEPQFETFAGTDPIAFVVSHNIHRRHLDVSQRAMIAAKIATMKAGDSVSQCLKNSEGGIPPPTTLKQAAALLNVHKDSVVEARKVLTEGTQEEIEAVEKGDAAVSTIAKKIRQRIPPEERMKKDPNANAARHATQIANGKMWRTFSAALINLTSLPLPADAARIVRGSDRHNLTNEKLLTALQWLQEFSDEWTSPEFDAKGNSRRKGKPSREAGEADPSQAAARSEGGGEEEGGNGEQRYANSSNGHWHRDQADDDHAGDGDRPA